MGDFHGLPTGELANSYLRLEYLLTAGPRLVRLIPTARGENLLAEVPEVHWDTPLGTFFPRGGHRLCAAPESQVYTYAPDNDSLLVENLPCGVRLLQTDCAPGCLRRSLLVHLDADRPVVTLTQTIRSACDIPLELAPWAITQLAAGGMAILPQPEGPLDPDGMLPNRQWVFWPYTQMRDPRLEWQDRQVVVRALPIAHPCKVGYFNRHGWSAYLWKGLIFLKRFTVLAGRQHPDFGCNVEVYTNHSFLELETLGPLACLKPGAELVHSEEWEILPVADAPQEIASFLMEANLL
jgi:hypothetical protein